MSEAMRAVVQQIVKNTAGWEAITSIIPNRVLCVELTSDNTVKIKIGDGLRTWSTLPYVSTGSVDLSDYYNKTQTDAAIATAITNLGSVMTLKGIVSSRENLPASNNSVGDVYLVGATGSTIDDFEEFVWTAANKWEYIGKIGTDMSVYYTKTETNGLLDNKVDKVSGKGLSTNDYTTTEKTKLAGLSNYDDTTVNNNMVRAGTADTNEQSQLYKTVDGTSTNIDPKCSLATKANRVNINTASTSANVELPLLAPGTQVTDAIYKIDAITFNPSKDELKTGMFKGGINTLVDHEAHNNVNNWRKVCEFSTNGHSNASGQCALSATILVTDGKYTSPKKGDALLRIVTHKEIKSGAFNNIINNFTMDLCTGTVVDNALSYKDPSSFKLTYTTNGTEITYKLWYYINRTYLSTNFILLSATSSYDTKSIVSEVDLSMGTLSADYMDDNGIAATGVVDCVLGVIANDIEGNAKTATLTTALKTATIAASTTVTTEEGWYQLAEWDISDVPSTAYFGYNILFVINGSKAYTTYGNATLKAICYGRKSNVGDATKVTNRLHLMSSSRVSGAELAFTESMFKLTFKMDSATKNITYKLWWHKDPSQLTHSERFSISLAMANDSENSSNRNIAYKIHLKSYPDVNYQIGATGYLENDPEVLAVDCAVADVYNTAMNANQVKLSVASRSANSLTPLLLTNSANATESGTQTVYKSKLGFNAYDKTLKIIPPSGSESTDEVVNISGNATTAGSATEANHAASADSATSANQLKLNVASTTAVTKVPILCAPSANPTTEAVQNVYKISEMTYQASTNTLNVDNISGKAKSLNSAYVYLPSTLSAGWKKVAEWTNASTSGYYNLAITLLVSGGRTGNTTSAISYGDNILKIFCFGNRTDSDVGNMSNMLSNILTIRTTNTTTFITSSNFIMTYTKNGKDITYKLWIQRTEANESILEAYGFTILSAIDTTHGTNFINDINLLSDGTFSTGATGYMTDGEVAATASVTCSTGTIGNGTTGAANSATSSTQTRQTLTTSNNDRPLLVSSSTNTSDTTANITGTVQRTNNIHANASTGTLTATSFVGDLTGNATSSTSISKNQDLLFDGVFTNNSLVIQDLFTNWKLIFMQLTWVKNQTVYTRELVLPLNILIAKTTFTIHLHTGDQVVFWKVDNDTIKHGTTYNDTKKFFAEAIVMGIY